MNHYWERVNRDKEDYLDKYIIKVIDEKTGIQTSFRFDCTKAYNCLISEVVGQYLVNAMQLLKTEYELTKLKDK